jgi:hypothetical protein
VPHSGTQDPSFKNFYGLHSVQLWAEVSLHLLQEMSQYSHWNQSLFITSLPNYPKGQNGRQLFKSIALLLPGKQFVQLLKSQAVV